MKRMVKIIVTEYRLYEVEGAKTDKEAVDIAIARTSHDSPLGLKDSRRNISDESGVVDKTDLS